MDDKSKAHPAGEAGAGGDPVKSSASPKSRRGLDWFVFFVADVQTGFGPFVAVYLTAQKWTQTDIGLILTVGGLIALFGQIPGGAILDAIRSPRLAAGLSVLIICISALMLAVWPIFPVVLASRILQAGASCVLGPAIAALSLGLVHRTEIGERLGRNASFASIGTGLAAAGMGVCGYYISNQAVFYVTAAFVFPALIALFQINPREIDPERAHGGAQKQPLTLSIILQLLTNRTLVIFALCVMLFHLANAAMLPLVASMLTLRSSEIGVSAHRRGDGGASICRCDCFSDRWPESPAMGTTATLADRLHRVGYPRHSVRCGDAVATDRRRSSSGRHFRSSARGFGPADTCRYHKKDWTI